MGRGGVPSGPKTVSRVSPPVSEQATVSAARKVEFPPRAEIERNAVRFARLTLAFVHGCYAAPTVDTRWLT